jgi:acetylglutamate kinase
MDPQTNAEILNQALPYIQRFRGHTFVVKYGGSAMRDPQRLRGVLRNVLLLQLVGIRVVLVHGGGPEINHWTDRLGLAKSTVGGLRVTDDETMDVVEMALGRSNKALVAEVEQAGGRGVGLSGRDAGLMVAEPISQQLGRVGSVVAVDPSILRTLLDSGFLPVVSSVASDRSGGALNVNADSAAAAIASAVDASKLVLLSDTDGIYEDKDRQESRLSTLSVRQARSLIEAGQADSGMIPKLEAAIHALEDGVERVHVINGGTPNALLIEVFTDSGIGTMLSRDV